MLRHRSLCTVLLLVAAGPVLAGGAWKVYHAGTSGVPGDVITALACDSLGNVWIGTDNQGVGLYDGTGWVVYPSGKAQQESIVTGITVTPNGDIMIAYNGYGGVGVISKKKLSAHTTSDVALPSNNVQKVASDMQGNVWIATMHGLGRRTPDGAWNNDPHVDLPSMQIATLATGRTGHVWLGFADIPGMALYDGRSGTYYDSRHTNFPDTRVLDLHADTNDVVWAGTETSGLVRFDNNQVTIQSTANSGIPGDKVQAIAMDARGRIWVGTATGAGVYDGTRWTTFTSENSPLPNNEVYAITIDRNGRAWFGTQVGLAVFTPE